MTAVYQEAWHWRRAMMRLDLPASAFRVAIALADVFMNRKKGKCYPSQEKIAEATGLSLSGVRKGLAALREAGLLATTKRYFNGSLSYAFLIPEPLRSDPNGAVREEDEVTQTGHTNYPKWDGRSDPNRTPNHRIEPEIETIEPEPVPSGPDGGASGTICSPFGRTPSSLSVSLVSTDELFLEKEIEVDESLLDDLDYVRRWLDDNCPDREHIKPIMRLAALNELTRRHLLQVAA